MVFWQICYTKMKKNLFFLVLILALNSQAQKNATAQHIAFAQLGSTGAGVGYQFQFRPKLAIGGNLTYMNAVPTLFLKNASQSKQHRITANANYTDLSVFLKWFPVGKEYYGEPEDYEFYFKGGLTHRLSSDLSVRTDYQLKQAGNNYNNADPVSGRTSVNIRVARIQPFVLIGHQLFGKNSDLKFYFEWGAAYHGTPKYTITQTQAPGIGPLNEKRIQQILNGITIYPILNAQLGYSF